MTRSIAGTSWPAHSRKCVGCSRTCSYSASGRSIRSAQSGSAHSQTKVASELAKRCAVSPMRSFTSLKTTSILAISTSLVPIDSSSDERRSSVRERRRRRTGFAVHTTLARMREWPEPVERVALFLREAGAEARVEEFPDGTPTAEAAARAVGCDLAQIVKSLVFDCDGRALLVLVPGDRRADGGKVAAAAGCVRVRIAGAEQGGIATGFPPGAVAPFPLRSVERVLVERTLLVHDVVWIGAGSSSHMAGLPPAELLRLSKAEPFDVVED